LFAVKLVRAHRTGGNAVGVLSCWHDHRGATVGNDQIIAELARSRYGGCLLCCETARKAEHSGAKAAADGLSVFG
jgi:hypothetical protein